MTLRMAIVGAGGIARSHAQTAASVEGVDLVAVCDVSAEVAERFAAAHQVDSFYTDVDELVQAQEIDIAVVCTWGSLHAEISNQLARSGKVRAVLCEKPISQNASECAEMIAVAEESGVLLAEAFKFRHHPMHHKMKKLVEDGAIGELRAIRSAFLARTRPRNEMRPELGWRYDPARGGGCVYDLACYCIHHARFITDLEPTTVFALGERHPVCGIHDQVAILFEFPGGVTAEISAGYRFHFSQNVEIHGTDGYLLAERAWNNENVPTTVEARFDIGPKPARRERYEWPEQDDMAHQLRHMMDCLEHGVAHRIQPQNSLYQMRAMDAVFESLDTGKPVHLNEKG